MENSKSLPIRRTQAQISEIAEYALGHRRERNCALAQPAELGCVMIAREEAIENYEIAAVECEMIARLATTDFRRDMYELLASKYRKLATDLAGARRVRDAA